MAVSFLADHQRHAGFFHRRILLNAQYWQDYMKDKATNIAALADERELILKAIVFALDLTEGWRLSYELIVTFSPFMERWGHWEIWNQILKRAIAVARSRNDPSGQSMLTALLARLLYQQGCFKESLSYYWQTIRIARQIQDQFNQARAYTNLGYYYIQHGQWYRAEVLCCHALKIFKQLNSSHGQAHTENHLGILYTSLHFWDQAQQHLEQACTIWQAIEDNHGLMRGYINLGGLYNDSKRPDKALINLKKALYLAELTGDETTLGRIYLNMGLAYILSEDFVRAEAHVQQAEIIFKKYTNLTELARAWDSLAAICFRQGKCSEAILLSEKSLQAWRRLKNTEDEINTLMDLIEYEKSTGQRQRAVERLRDVEHLIGPFDSTLYRHHLPQFIKIYRSLIGQMPQQATIDLDG